MAENEGMYYSSRNLAAQIRVWTAARGTIGGWSKKRSVLVSFPDHPEPRWSGKVSPFPEEVGSD